LFLTWGWRRLQVQDIDTEDGIFVSIIIPVRDEVKNVVGLLRYLEGQSYPKQNFEVIVVDDQSKDGTYQKMVELSRVTDLNVSIFKLPVNENTFPSHKKAALTFGIEKAAGEIILMTDADVQLGEQWIQSYVTIFSGSDTRFISGPVMMKGDHFTEEVQSIEFASLIGTGAALLYFNIPVMCNGANLAFRKEAFWEVGGYEDNMHVISGDDEFLMHKISKLYPSKVFFLKSIQNTVWIRPVSRFRDFYNQRRRWSGKWKMHANVRSILLALYIFTVHCSLLAFIVLGLFKFMPAYTVISIWLIKIIIEYIFLLLVFQFFAKRLKIFPFIISSLLYSFYAVTFGILANFGGYVWKGRRYKD
jgi:cellulose synthase/poly-beta-1,6-N-acetylglucosamine synthase-like glycosyltransferase